MGRKRLELKKIENDRYRLATFSKRSSISQELSSLTAAQLSVLVLSPQGIPYLHGPLDFLSEIFPNGNSVNEENQESTCGCLAGLGDEVGSLSTVEELLEANKKMEVVKQRLMDKLKVLEEDDFVASLFCWWFLFAGFRVLLMRKFLWFCMIARTSFQFIRLRFLCKY